MARVPVIRVQQFTKGSLSSIGREADRAELNSRNEDIDKSRSELNVVVKAPEEGTLYRAWNKWRADHGCSEQKINKTMTAFEGAVLTASPEVFRDLGWDKDNPTPEAIERCTEFLMTQYEYLKDKIGEDRILSAHIHFDETTPHMQVYYIPAVDFVMQKQYAKDEQGKILRNEKGSPIYARDDRGKIITERVEGVRINRGAFWGALGGKNSYNQMQTEHFSHMFEAFPDLDLERGQEGSTAEHTTKYQWHEEQMTNKLSEINTKLVEAEISIGDKEDELEYLEKKVTDYKEQNKEYLTAAEVQAINDKAKVGIFGVKNVKPSEYEAIVRTAGVAEQAIKDKEAAEARAKAAEEKAKLEIEKAKVEAEEQLQLYVAEANRQLDLLRKADKDKLDKALEKAEAEYQKYDNWNISFGKTRMEAELRVVNKQNARYEAFIKSNPDIAERFKIFQKGSKDKSDLVK